MTQADEEARGVALLDEIRAALRSPEVRIELDIALSLSRGAIHSARIYLPGPTTRSKWRLVGMRILAPEGQNSRRGLIAHLSDLYGGDE